MDAETPAHGLAWQVHLGLLIDVGLFQGAAAVGAAGRQVGLVALVGGVVGRRSMAVAAVLSAGFAAGRFGVGLGGPFGEGGGLAFAGAAGLIEVALQLRVGVGEAFDLGLEFIQAALQFQTLVAGLHVG
jgi:hypothetical protein